MAVVVVVVIVVVAVAAFKQAYKMLIKSVQNTTKPRIPYKNNERT